MHQSFRRFTEDPAAPYRLGRHQVHDWLLPERRATVDHLEPIKSVDHVEYQDSFDQGQIGSCTMNAGYGTLVTAPFGKPGVSYTQDTIQDGYRMETRIDDSQIPGQWEPNDTGSTGVWSMLVLQQLGLIASYQHTTDMATALRLLSKAPISIGVTWWNSFFTPDRTGTLVLDQGQGIGGGHQIAITANDVGGKRVRLRQSWGLSWGLLGHAWIPYSVLSDLMDDGGDVVQPVMAGAAT